MTSSDAAQFGKTEAQRLLKLGWAQGQILAPRPGLPSVMEGSVLVVCTQSCSVVSDSLEKDPFVELAQASPVQNFNPKADQATGKNARRFHLPVQGADYKALEVDINSRQFVPRGLLLDLEPEKHTISQKARRDFAAWLGRYYSRIDLPNELVDRLKQYFIPNFEKFLKGTVIDGKPERRHERIGSMWIKYSPDVEQESGAKYVVEILILCDDAELGQRFDRAMIALFGEKGIQVDGLEVKFAVNSPDETFVSELHKYHRFTDWDHLSGPWDAQASSNG